MERTTATAFAMIVLVACGPAEHTGVPGIAANVPSVERPSQPTATQSQASITPSPSTLVDNTPTPASPPTITPQPRVQNLLSPEGPWLVYTNADDLSFAVNLDGSGRTRLPLTAADNMAAPYAGSSSRPLLALISNDYSNELGPLLDILSFPELEALEEIELRSCPEVIPGCVIDEEAQVWLPLQWSPDGRYLAFVAAIEGPSTDLYLYDAAQASISRLTSGPNQVSQFAWSPDGKWIVHEEVSHFHGSKVETMWAAAADGREIRWLYAPEGQIDQGIAGWLDDDRFIVYDQGMDGLRNLRLVSIEDGILATLFPGYFVEWSYALDPATGTFAFIPYIGAPNTDPDENGVYYVSVSSTIPKRVDIDDAFIQGWDETTQNFLSDAECPNQGDGVLGFTVNGVVSCVHPRVEQYSPDGKWYLVLDEEILIYENSGRLVGQIANSSGRLIIWRPDSQGFFMVSKGRVDHVDIGKGLPVLVDSDLGFSDMQWFDLGLVDPVWVRK